MTRICLVTCYFGSWPEYINLFLSTCRRNPSIDFLFFSDCGPLPNAPSNVRLVPMTVDDVRQRARQRIGVEPAIEEPYDLCDFKPTYGVLFEDYLKSYEFWGCTDLDLIYGEIREFITEKLLLESDVISARAPYLTGFFCLFRNQDYVNRLYEKSSDLEKALENSGYLGFDECNHKWGELINGSSIFELDTDIESMTEVIRREEQAGHVRCHFADFGREVMEGTEFVWDEGKLFERFSDRSVERMLFHFVLLKGEFYFTFPDWDTVPSRYHVRPTGFYRDHELNGLDYLRALPVKKICQQWGKEMSKKAHRRLPW